MTVIDDLVEHLANHHWEPLTIERDDDRLELVPLHGKVGVGFTLWERRPPHGWAVVVSGHWEAVLSGTAIGGQTFARFGVPLELRAEVRRRMRRLLRSTRRAPSVDRARASIVSTPDNRLDEQAEPAR